MRVDGFKVHGALSLAVLAAGVAAAIAGHGTTGVTLAGPEVLRLIQQSPAALSTYPAIAIDGFVRGQGNGRSLTEKFSGTSTADGRTGTLTFELPGHALSVRYVHGTLYSRIPAAGLPAFDGHHWLSCTPPSSTPARDATPSDPYSFLKLMPMVTGQVRVMGHQTVRGVPTTHYRAHLSIVGAVQLAQSRGQVDLSPDELQQLESLRTKTEPIDVWLDAQHVLRRLESHLNLDGFTLTEQYNVNGTTTVPQVSAPAAADTMDESPCSFMFQQLGTYLHG